MGRITHAELKRQSAELDDWVRMTRILHQPVKGPRMTVVSALMATSMPELMKVHPAFSAASTFVKDQRRVLARIPYTWPRDYRREDDTFAGPSTYEQVNRAVQDQRITCLRCKGSGEYEGEYGPTSCMGCIAGPLQFSDGLGNPLEIDEGQTLIWYSDMTFEVA